MTEQPRARVKKKLGKEKQQTYLEGMVSRTKKFKVEDLLDIYKVYDELVTDIAFRLLLLPYTRFAKTWLRDQARDLLAGTDRNRLIMTARCRKQSEIDFEDDPRKKEWTHHLKPKHAYFARNILSTIRSYNNQSLTLSMEEVRGLGVSRLVFDDLGLYFISLTNSYPTIVADYLSAKACGDHKTMMMTEAYLRTLEEEVGVKREHAWYVVVNTRSIYDRIDKIVQTVTLAYSRLLFRFAHQLRGVTSTEENFSAGYEGMIRAARNYDPIDGASFTAHCNWWVRSAVLQRQRQASIIILPTTTWYQLSLLSKGQGGDLSDTRVSDLKERAEMFYASSANMKATEEDQDDMSFDSTLVNSPDAHYMMGDAVRRSQEAEDTYLEANVTSVGRECIEEAFALVTKEDPSLLFPVLLWALNRGIDVTLLAEILATTYISDADKKTEHQRHQATKVKLHQSTLI